MPPPDWSSIQEGKGEQTSRHGAEQEEKKKNKNKIKTNTKKEKK